MNRKLCIVGILFLFSVSLLVSCGDKEKGDTGASEIVLNTVEEETIQTETVRESMETETEIDRAKDLSDSELTFIRTILCAIGYRQYQSTDNLADETIAEILLTLPDIEYICYDVEDFLPYTSEGSQIYVDDAELRSAANAVFGRDILAEQVQVLNNLAGYEVDEKGYTRDSYNGHGKWHEVHLDDIQYEDKELIVDYSYISYDSAESSQKREASGILQRKAVLHFNDNTSWPFQVMSVLIPELYSEDSSQTGVFAVKAAYQQLFQYGIKRETNDMNSFYEVQMCSLFHNNPYDLGDYYQPTGIWAYYFEDINFDSIPELILISDGNGIGRAAYVLIYNDSGFDVTMFETPTIIRYTDETGEMYYCSLLISGGYDEDIELIFDIEAMYGNPLETKNVYHDVTLHSEMTEFEQMLEDLRFRDQSFEYEGCLYENVDYYGMDVNNFLNKSLPGFYE